MATKKLQILTELCPSDEKIQSTVDEFFATSPVIKTVVDKFCPPFEASGSVVTCHPAEGYPLTVTTQDGATTVTRNGESFTPGEPIPALSGANTIFADVGLVTVSGRADPNYVIDTLLDRVTALEAAAVNNT